MAFLWEALRRKLCVVVDFKKGWPAKVAANAGRMPVQIRYEGGLTGEEYVIREAWRSASLPCCPKHPKGGCGFARHGTYERMDPPGTMIPRWYCPDAHQTFSLLPDHLAARFPGTLAQFETVVTVVEAAPSLEVAADRLRPDDISLASALRWIRRRVHLARAVLVVTATLFADDLCGCVTIQDLQSRLQFVPCLVHLREQYPASLPHLPRPLGFISPQPVRCRRKKRFQQRMGADPPAQTG